ncbi:MAG: triose-phosphate transporter family protein [Clostridiales bacterium]|nr:triose-phosphate transporter family protein [Clostridiales bacterium]
MSAYLAILFISVFISAFSQVLLKKSALRHYDSFIKEYFNFFVISAYLIFFIAVFLDLFALSRVPVSLIPVVESSSYVFAFVFGVIFFKEKVSARKIMSMILILGGIFVYSLDLA